MPVPVPASRANEVAVAARTATARQPASRVDARAMTAASAARVKTGAKAGAALVWRSLTQSLKPLLAVCVVLASLQVVLVLEASSQHKAQAFSRIAEMLPDFLRRTLGDLTLVAVSFQGAVCAGYFHPVIVLLVSMLGIYFGSEPAHDVEAGVVDLVLARPLRRHWLITRSLTLIVLGTGAAPVVMALTMWTALVLFAPADAPWPAPAQIAKMAITLAAVAATAGTISLAVASYARRRGTALAVAGIVTVFCYLVTFLEPTWAPVRTIGWLSPFHYFHPLNILAARMEPWRDLLILGSVGSLLSVIAYWQFSRRDL